MTQHDVEPPPIPAEASEDAPWMAWLRMLLCINLVLGSIDLLGRLRLFFELGSEIARSRTTGLMWLTPAILVGILVPIGLPVMFVLFSIGLLQRRPGARIGLIIYCWAELGIQSLQLLRTAYMLSPRFLGLVQVDYITREFIPIFYRCAVALITLLFITRPQVKALFVREDRGFEVLRG